jgi:hypothetical protein
LVCRLGCGQRKRTIVNPRAVPIGLKPVIIGAAK